MEVPVLKHLRRESAASHVDRRLVIRAPVEIKDALRADRVRLVWYTPHRRDVASSFQTREKVVGQAIADWLAGDLTEVIAQPPQRLDVCRPERQGDLGQLEQVSRALAPGAAPEQGVTVDVRGGILVPARVPGYPETGKTDFISPYVVDILSIEHGEQILSIDVANALYAVVLHSTSYFQID
jgi:hypothetical protein